MAVVIAEHELIHSCRVLFGADKKFSRSFLEYIQLSGIKSAYRKKAFETHPDVLASRNGRPTQQCGDLFQIVQQAYENLKSYLDARERGFRFQVSPKPTYTARPRPTTTKKTWTRPQAQKTQYQWTGARKDTTNQTKTNKRYGGYKQSFNNRYNYSSQATSGPIPSRRLLFGHYLYYSGITNWQTIIKAIVWQRTERPRIGELACKYGWLSSKDILTVLRGRKLTDSFGKSAINMGMLTNSQLQILLFQQKKLQKKFGQYFIHNKLITSFELQRLVRQFYSHNTSFSAQQARSYQNRM